MLKVDLSKKYTKSIKRLSKSGKYDFSNLYKIVRQIRDEEILDPIYRDHQLHGNLSEYRECHIQSDLLLVYKIDKETNTLVLFNFGTHSELF